MKILLVDDDKKTTSMLSKFLNLKGFSVEVSNEPWEGLDLIQQEKFDVILLDQCMPNLSGEQIIKTLATDNMLHDKNIFILSANFDHPFKVNDFLRREGITGCLSKPIDLDELLDIITNKKPIPEIKFEERTQNKFPSRAV